MNRPGVFIIAHGRDYQPCFRAIGLEGNTPCHQSSPLCGSFQIDRGIWQRLPCQRIRDNTLHYILRPHRKCNYLQQQKYPNKHLIPYPSIIQCAKVRKKTFSKSPVLRNEMILKKPLLFKTLPVKTRCIANTTYKRRTNRPKYLIMEWIFNQLRERPELAIFLTIFLGFWLGKLRIGKFTLGTVTSVLLVGVVVGQLNIAVPGPVKSVFSCCFCLP